MSAEQPTHENPGVQAITMREFAIKYDQPPVEEYVGADAGPDAIVLDYGPPIVVGDSSLPSSKSIQDRKMWDEILGRDQAPAATGHRRLRIAVAAEHMVARLFGHAE
ncbi:MAG: hypothetical protein ACHQT9_03365 [Candidatus Saccharimonadales bacterium]